MSNVGTHLFVVICSSVYMFVPLESVNLRYFLYLSVNKFSTSPQPPSSLRSYHGNPFYRKIPSLSLELWILNFFFFSGLLSFLL